MMAGASEQRSESPAAAVAVPVSTGTRSVTVPAPPGLLDTAHRIVVTKGRKALLIDQQMSTSFILVTSQNNSLFNNRDISIV